MRMKQRGLMIMLLLVGCAPNYAVWEAPEVAFPTSATTYYLEVSCERCERHSLDHQIEEIVATTFPQMQRLSEAVVADITVRYAEGDSVICVDCEEQPVLRSWWWSAKLYRQPGTKEKLFAFLSGDVDKLRGHPNRFFRQQLIAYAAQQDRPNSTLHRTLPRSSPPRERYTSRRAGPRR
jgi:hypothetical protein